MASGSCSARCIPLTRLKLTNTLPHLQHDALEMTASSQGILLYVHTELEGDDQEPNTHRFCVPIYITDGFGTNLKKESDLVPNAGEQPKIRSGTLTFVRRGDYIYGITCRHVVEALEREEAEAQAEWKRFHSYSPPEWGLRGFYFPMLSEQVHINARFHKAHVDGYTGEGKDVAIAVIPHDTFAKTGREAIPFERLTLPPADNTPHLCGIATGFPEGNRISRATDGPVNMLSMPTVAVRARFGAVSDSSLLLYDELDHLPEADNLSGMSGGPILWSGLSGWGLAGIVKKGRDIHPRVDVLEGMTPIVDVPTVWMTGEPLTASIFEELIALIPKDDKPVTYYAPRVIPVRRAR